MRPFVHSGDSANIAYYGEDRPDAPDRVWATVLRSDLYRHASGEMRTRRIPDFSVTVYRGTTANKVAEISYTPRTRPGPGALPARTVARLVREALT